MKKVLKFCQKNTFIINTAIFILVIIFMPINDIDENNRFKLIESIRIVLLVAVLVIAVIYHSRLVKYANVPTAFYYTDKFYCDLMYVALLTGVSFTIHFINWETTNIHSAIKVWEITAYTVTFIYTFWLWFIKIGFNIIEILEHKYGSSDKQKSIEKWQLITAVGFSLLFLFGIIISHVVVTLTELESISMLISVLLIFLTYVLFTYISKKIVILTESKLENPKQDVDIERLNVLIEDYQDEFKFGLKYMDYPMMLVFLIMSVYALYATCLDYFASKHTMAELELFFGGAIAFELLLSSFVWAKNN